MSNKVLSGAALFQFVTHVVAVAQATDKNINAVSFLCGKLGYRLKTALLLFVIRLRKHCMSYLYCHQDILSSNRKQHMQLPRSDSVLLDFNLISPTVICFLFFSNIILTILLLLSTLAPLVAHKKYCQCFYCRYLDKIESKGETSTKKSHSLFLIQATLYFHPKKVSLSANS